MSPKSFEYIRSVLLALSGFLSLIFYANAGDIRDNVEDRGYVRCGVVQTNFYYKTPIKEMAQDLCRGLALALFPDPNALKIVSLSEHEAGRALAEGRIDVVAMANRKRLSHQEYHINASTLFINSLDIAILFKGYKVRDLGGKKICSLDWVDKTSLAIFGQKHQISLVF
jgi:general L-amino acid transport system substrate-binding protein